MLAGLGLASADCERIVGDVLAQPTNAVSSLSFLFAGAWVALRSARASVHRVELALFGLAIAANALGGLLYHGTQTATARTIHDVAIASVLLLIAVFDLARLGDRSTGWTVRTYLLALACIGLLLSAAPVSAYPVFALLGVAIGWWELAEYRQELPRIRHEGVTARRAARLGLLVALLLAGTAFFVGRSGALLCDPSSAMQWHAVWHVLSALAMALYAYGAIEPHPEMAR